MKQKLQEFFPAPLQSIWANPVVVRDLRAQMRGTKSYWFQGVYLLLLGILAISGYAQATGQGFAGLQGPGSAARISIVEAQGRLEGFYYFIFLTLATLITLIAPAMTASAVIGERQRQSLDLLITTPLTAGELLVGKLLSSIAFLGLLLALSLPASALCVLLGGAALTDVFRIYALLAIDGIVLSAVGLFFSCTSRTNLLALVWTYLTVAILLAGTWSLCLYCAMDGNLTQNVTATPLLFLTALNPFIAVLPVGQMAWGVGPLSVPVWLGAAGAALLILRLLVTASTYRLGSHGGQSGPSLRRQILLLSGAGGFVIVYSSLYKLFGGRANPMISEETLVWGIFLGLMLLAGFGLAVPFLPSLFVPVSAEDAPPGVTESAAPVRDRAFRLRRVFAPEHSAALPYFFLLIAVLLSSTLIAFRAATGLLPLVVIGVALCSAFYVSGLGVSLWGISQFAAVLMPGAGQARGIAFGIFAFLCGSPLLVLSLTTPSSRWGDEPVAILWLLYPLLTLSRNLDTLPLWLLICGLQGFAWGFAFVLARMRWNRRAAAVA